MHHPSPPGDTLLYEISKTLCICMKEEVDLL